MNLPKARQLKSGSWNIQVTLNGERYSITRPTKKEVEAEATYRIARAETGRQESTNPFETMTVREILDKYIEENAYRLSPVSIQDYRSIQRNRFKGVMDRQWNVINWERAIANELSKYRHNTVQTAWGVIKTAARSFGLDTYRIRVKFPKTDKQEHAFLTLDQMHVFQKAIRGNQYELPCLLGLLSLRLSEIEGLRRKDIDLERGFINVCHTKIRDTQNHTYFELDKTKTAKSTRTIPLVLNPRIAELVGRLNCKPDDYVVPYTAQSGLYRYINKTCEELGFPKIGVHGLRHTFASVCWSQGIPMETCMLYGGWASDTTVKNVYQHLDDKVVGEHALRLAKAFSLDGIDLD